jgi:competence protein ComEA
MQALDKVLEIIEQYKITLVLGLVGTLLIGLGFLLPNFKNEKKPIVVQKSTESSKVAGIKIDIEGAIKNPGVYSLAQGERVLDAIYAAGGFTDQTDSDWLTKNVNLARIVEDGEKVYINALGEISDSLPQVKTAQTQSGKININKASSSELDTLPGIGEKTAAKIIDNRPYKSANDLVAKKVVGTATFNKIKDLVSVQ